MIEPRNERAAFFGALFGGAAAGALSAAVNASYFLAFRASTEFAGAEPSLGSVVVSSLFPSLLAGLGYGVLQRLTPRSRLIFALLTAFITVGSFAGAFQSNLPNGAPKPPGFDQLVLPMHVVVGFLAAWLIPFFAACPSNPRVAR